MVATPVQGHPIVMPGARASVCRCGLHVMREHRWMASRMRRITAGALTVRVSRHMLLRRIADSASGGPGTL